jgi:hypothetical protein
MELDEAPWKNCCFCILSPQKLEESWGIFQPLVRLEVAGADVAASAGRRIARRAAAERKQSA